MMDIKPPAIVSELLISSIMTTVILTCANHEANYMQYPTQFIDLIIYILSKDCFNRTMPTLGAYEFADPKCRRLIAGTHGADGGSALLADKGVVFLDLRYGQ